jgi:hypothetical protein
VNGSEPLSRLPLLSLYVLGKAAGIICRLLKKPWGGLVGGREGRLLGHWVLGGGWRGVAVGGLGTTGEGHCEGPIHFGYVLL